MRPLLWSQSSRSTSRLWVPRQLSDVTPKTDASSGCAIPARHQRLWRFTNGLRGSWRHYQPYVAFSNCQQRFGAASRVRRRPQDERMAQPTCWRRQRDAVAVPCRTSSARCASSRSLGNFARMSQDTRFRVAVYSYWLLFIIAPVTVAFYTVGSARRGEICCGLLLVLLIIGPFVFRGWKRLWRISEGGSR